MIKMPIKKSPTSTTANAGINAERDFAYTLTGELRDKHDNGAFDKGNDCGQYSVKSARFSLCSGLVSMTVEGQIAEYFERTAAEFTAYVAKDGNAYIMNDAEFAEFLTKFCKLVANPTKANPNGLKLRMGSESKEVKEWLTARV